MAKVEKQFDAVQMMRSIRDRMSKKIRDMTFEEEQAYIRQRLREEPLAELFDTDNVGPVKTGRAVEGKGKS